MLKMKLKDIAFTTSSIDVLLGLKKILYEQNSCEVAGEKQPLTYEDALFIVDLYIRLNIVGGLLTKKSEAKYLKALDNIKRQ